MKTRLKQIYQDVADGRLTQNEALEKIRILKLQEEEKKTGVLLSSPNWIVSNLSKTTNNTSIQIEQQYITLFELPKINTQEVDKAISNSKTVHVQLAQQKNIAEAYYKAAQHCFNSVKEILAKKPLGKTIFQIVIPNNQEEMLLIGLSGLLKSITTENPNLLGQLIIVAPSSSTLSLTKQLEENKHLYQDKIIKYENGIRKVLRLKEIKTTSKAPNIVFKEKGTYLITGGLGGVGILLVKEIASQSPNATIILVGRSKINTHKKKIIDSLISRGLKVEYQQVDISNLKQVTRLFKDILSKYKQLNGIMHCAGITKDNFAVKKSSEEFKTVLLPKVHGTYNIDQASKEIDLDFMVLFSSVASWLGNIGQTDYAAANGFMDQFAVYRNHLVNTKKRKGKTVSINWPLWQDGGMKIDPATSKIISENTGLQSLETAKGMHSFYRSLELPYAQIMVTEGDYKTIRKQLFEMQPINQKKIVKTKISDKKINIKTLFEKAQDFISNELATQLKIAPQQLDAQTPLEKYGIDSILSMNLTNQLEKTFGSLPKTLFFEYLTIHDLTGYFIKSFPDTLHILFNDNEEAQEREKTTTSSYKPLKSLSSKITGNRFIRHQKSKIVTKTTHKQYTDDSIAIIGLSGRYPEAKDIAEYWQNLRDGKDCIIEVPKDRWDWKDFYTEDRTKTGHHYSKWGGFITGVDEFDPRFFNISPRESKVIDPQERLFLQHTWMAVEDAGYTRDSLQISKDQELAGQVGVYVGVMYGEYQLFGVQGKPMGLVNSYASIANRVSYVLNLHGPSMTLDTMCSSSLTAIHLACQDLKLGRTNMAIAGGVNVSIHPNKYLFLSASQFVSSNGHCESFGEGGDGYIPGEGVGVVILKRLSEAIKDGDHIYGVIKGSSLNHGGKTNGYSVPNPNAQSAAISRALAESKIDPRHISYIEAHGTGTKLGDPIEIRALDSAFKKYTQDNGYCLIGSAKSNVGHCESAAAIAGLTKVLLQMQHKQIVPSLHSAKLNPYIDFKSTPFIVNQTLKNWEQPTIKGRKIPRIAGVSSFGAGGSNAHIIIEEYQEPVTSRPLSIVVNSNQTYSIPLSARTDEQLKQKAVDLLAYIEDVQPALNEMAYTLQVGREAMDKRLGFVVSSNKQLISKLKAYIEGETTIKDVYQDKVKQNGIVLSPLENDEDIEKWISQHNNSKIIELWVKGFKVDWNKLYKTNKPKRITLPTYPFAKEKYWIEIENESSAATTPSKAIHPLLHTNTSDFTQQSYSSIFTGNEFIFTNSQAKLDSKVLLTSTYLEMARAAIENAIPVEEESRSIELQNVVFGEPFTHKEEKQLTIALFSNANKQVDFEIYSNDGKEEIIHCQGSAAFHQQKATTPLKIEQLKLQLPKVNVIKHNTLTKPQEVLDIYQNENQLLIKLLFSALNDDTSVDFTVHPTILNTVLQASIPLIGYELEPYAIESASIFAPCKKEMFAWIRFLQNSKQEEIKLAIDLCDIHGNLCMQLHGVSYQGIPKNKDVDTQVPVQKVSTVPKQKEVQNIEKESIHIPVKISFADTLPQGSRTVKLQNTSLTPVISLSTPAVENFSSKNVKRAAIQLEDTNLHFSLKASVSSSNLAVELYNLGKGIFSIEIAADNNNLLSKNLITQLIAALSKVRQQDLVKTVIIKGTAANFLHGSLPSYTDAIELELFKSIITFPYPVIADMRGDASGVGLLFGIVCDFMICSEEGHYSYTNYSNNFYPTSKDFQVFEERFETFRAIDLLYFSTVSTGKQLKEKGYTFPILSKATIETFIQKLASNLSTKPQEALGLLKKHLSRKIFAKVNNLDSVTPISVALDNKKTVGKISNTVKHINLEIHHKNILEIKLGIAQNGYGIKTLVSDLTNIITQVNKTTQYKVIVLTSEHQNFLPIIDNEVSVNDILSFQRLIFESNYPIIAVLNSNTIGLAWIMTLFCDACIYNEDSVYAVTNSWKSSKLAKQAAMILSYRFGNTFAKEILLSSDEFTGLELKKRAGILNTASKQTVLSRALQLAKTWAKIPTETMVAWKKQMVQSIRDKIKALPVWLASKEKEIKSTIKKPVLVPLKSNVISATSHPEGILVVTMKDREAKNMFSETFEQGMIEVFNHIEKSQHYKVVVVIGYDNYFASGGTKESLLAIQQGKVKFTDTKIFQLGMTCKLPVIAAMQGHGIGAGWSMGMFADFMLFSEESKYMSPYMNFGFTPGAGATYIFPEKMGYDISRETLFTAQEFSGSELKERGVLIPVVPRKQVYKTALYLAKEIAKCSQTTLIAFKNQFTQQQLVEAEKVFKDELAMHEKTFVGKSDTLDQILKNFDQGNAEKNNEKEVDTKVQAKTTIQNEVVQTNTTQDTDILTEITDKLRKILAEELHLETYEIEDHLQFIDLGLDSITGVTWIRKINEIYKTNIEATKIYSYPTLAQLSQFVKEEADKLGVFDYLKEEDKTVLATVSVQENKSTPVENTEEQLDILPEVTSTLREILAKELHLEEHEIEDNIQFIDLGLDSITGVTWIRKINEIYKINIEATKIYSYPTLAQLSQFVKEEAEKQGTFKSKQKISKIPVKIPQILKTPSPIQKLVSRRKKATIKKGTTVNAGYQSEPIAIIGMSGQFPKAKNIDAFWKNISQGKNCITEVPKERWDTNTFYIDGKATSGKTNCKWMGALEEYDLFDPLFFNISPTEAESMDPQQRVLLQSCWNSIENAGYNPKLLSGSKCGVYIGCASGDYHLLSRNLQISAQGFTGGATSVLAARISYLLNLQGPCLSIDTACSSSLVAIATACENLISRSCDLALAGGVYVMVGPDMHIKSSQTGMLSVDGKCYTFDNRANGFVPGEGVGVVMLKRLSDAEKDNDIIHGVIEGWGINQDGKTNGITAPNKESQVRLQQEVYDKFKIDPTTIQLVEAHGTGTKLGDPIEVEALNDTFKKYTDNTAYCALGSVKSNIGHSLTAAGVASFIKTLQALKHKQLPPTINYNQLNEHISLKESPFFINTKLQEWNVKDTKRRAAISAFGFSGTNAHIVVSEYQTPQEVHKPISVITQNSKLIIPISARTKDQLKQRVIDLLNFVNEKEHSITLLEVAYTLQVGRQAMEERLCLLVSSVEELIEKLQAYINNEEHIRNLYQGQVKRNKESLSIINRDSDLKATIIDTWIKQHKLSNLVDLWVKGMELDWNKLYGEAKPQRISLPNYPFAKERYWVEDVKDVAKLKATKVSVLHPLVHTNTSDLDQQCYQTIFHGEEFLIENHQVNGQKVIPALAQLEMAYEAVMHATSTEKNTIAVDMYNVVWDEPVFINSDKKVSIAIIDNDTNGIGYEIFSSENQDELMHCEGDVFFSTENSTEKLNISQLIASLGNSVFKKDSFYEALAKMNITIGSSLQGLTATYSDSNQLLAQISIPASVASTLSDYCLHPSIMDSTLQACLAFVLDFDNLPNQPLQPIALDFIRIISKCTDNMYAYVRSSQEKPRENNLVKLDIDICDAQGNSCIILQGLELGYANISTLVNKNTVTKDLWDKTTYVYRWEEQARLKEKTSKDYQSVLIVCNGSSNKFDAVLKEQYSQKENCELTILYVTNKTKQLSETEWQYDCHSSDSLQKCLQRTRKIDAFYFLAIQEDHTGSFTFEELKNNQESNEIQLLRIVKNLKENNKISEKVDTYILTCDNYTVNQMPSGCFGAGITGFAYSLAQGNYQFLVRNLDVSSNDFKNKESQQQLIKTIHNEPATSRGELIKLQVGRRYKQVFIKLNWDTSNPSVIREKGIYLIVGGTGTVGKIITQHLVQKYNAQVIWLGRSAANSEKVQVALQSQKEFKDNVFYYKANVMNQQSMQDALKQIKTKFTQIHGAIFAGMVFDFENSIDKTTEEEFRNILETKTQGSWVFYHVLQKEALDFMCYFSSGQAYSFSGAAKLSAYATAITFADRLVQRFNTNSIFPIGIINWGFWKSSVAVIANDNDGVSTGNLDALENNEGFACFEKFVSELDKDRINQVLCMKVSEQLKSVINISNNKYVTLTNEQFSCEPLEIEIPHQKVNELVEAHKQNQLENWLAKLVFSEIDNMVKQSGKDVGTTVEKLQKQCGISKKYIKWFNEALDMLTKHGYIQLKDGLIKNWKEIDSNAIIEEWKIQKEIYCKNIEFKSLVILLDDCLQKLPEIMQEKQLATDIIFPNASMKKVEGIYKNNTTSDTFNEIVANSVVAYLQQKLKSNPTSQLRILEIGAGTGGTSTIVFQKLKPFQKSIEKYCYTDLSKAFFFHAEKNYIPENPYIVCQRLDIEKPIENQGIELGSYDLVIATNVLHATKDIRNTLRNAKAALYKNGYLILNEMSNKSLTTHLTFGLLDGWWLFNDGDLRIPNCPGLYPKGWQRVLEEEGFTSVNFPVQKAHVLGQQIILAKSNGVIEQKETITVVQKNAKKVATKSREIIIPKKELKKITTVSNTKINVKEHIKTIVLKDLSTTLKMAIDTIDPEIAFSDYGLDSILGVNFVNQVNDNLSIALNTAIIFEYSSTDKLSNHIYNVYKDEIEKLLITQREITSAEIDETNTKNQPADQLKTRERQPINTRRSTSFRKKRKSIRETKSNDIAVIGMSGMMPKANSIEAFWNNIINGIDGVEELPPHYLDHDTYYSVEKKAGKTRCKWGGIVDERDCFDPLFFNLSPWEAESMNPHQRLVLQEGWKAIENSGYNPKSLSGTNTGVYIGVEPSGYQGDTFTGYSDAIISSRISYTLNLKGPALSINTGCSSSGVALHLACESLRNRETNISLVGGVNACMDHSVQIRLDEIDMLSPKGRCNTFDEGGSGTIISEGVGMVVLKRLEDAIADNDFIHGVICGSGTNQDGASNGITAPNGAAQEELMVNVYHKFGINPEDISYVEAHGTGTKLGDPIEANALVRAFKKFTTNKGYCAVGSAKSHIGHTGAAAGVTGLIKVLQSMQHNKIPKLLHFNKINPLIEFDNSPFYIPTQTIEWNSNGKPLMAALNSFGHSGTNVHLVVREFVSNSSQSNQEPIETVIIPLSAKTADQLKQKAKDLLHFIQTKENSSAIHLNSMAYTLQLGREAMSRRLGFVVNSVKQLSKKLQDYINSEQKEEGIYQGNVKKDKEALSLFIQDTDLQETVKTWIDTKKYERIVELWVKGLEFDWTVFYPNTNPKRMSLPSYPFEKERYWYTKRDSDNGIDNNLLPSQKIETIHNMEAIESIIDQIDNDSMEKEKALALLKNLV